MWRRAFWLLTLLTGLLGGRAEAVGDFYYYYFFADAAHAPTLPSSPRYLQN